MEMRLGKTLLAIRWVQGLPEARAKRCIVVAPITVLNAWRNELTIEGECYIDVPTLKNRMQFDQAVEEATEGKHRVWFLINYEMAVRRPELADVFWDVALVDESVKLKNPKADVTKYFVDGFRQVRYRAVLTGLPNPESELEFFTQFQFLHGKFMGYKNFWQWRNKYFERFPLNPHQWEPKRGTRALIKKAVHELAYVVRRKDVFMDNKVFERRVVPMLSEQRKMYESVIRDFAYEMEDGWHETQWAMQAATWLARIAGGFTPDGSMCLSNSKALDMISLFKGELAGEQVVVWFRFVKELQLVAQLLTAQKISWAKIDGSTDPILRERAIVDFRQGKKRILLATEKCAKMGIDCSVADTCIYYSNEWSCDDRLQSEDRIVSPIKQVPLLYIDMCTEGTVDEDCANRIRMKKFNASEMLRAHTERIWSQDDYELAKKIKRAGGLDLR